MTDGAHLCALRWLLLTLAGAICCTRLDNGSDSFGPQKLAGGAGSEELPGGVGSAGQSNAGGPASGGGAGVASEGEGALGGEAAGGVSCTDDSGFDGLGCYRCQPTDVFMLENACTDATCQPFDGKLRLPRLVADRLPELPKAPGSAGSGGGGSGGTGGNQAVGFACDALASSGTVIYVAGSTAAKPFLERIAQQLSIQEKDKKVYLVYASLGSCAGVDAIVNSTLLRTGPAPLPASATYWESSSSPGKACDLPPQGVSADLGISDVFAQSCQGFELTSLEALKIRDAHGPIQTMTFAVPSNSAYHEISQQAAYLVFGFGKDGQVLDPSGTKPIWNDEKSIFQRSSSSGTQAMLAAAIGVPAGSWKGVQSKGSDDVANALLAAAKSEATANATLGILGADYIDSRNLRAQIRALAFQDTHQACAVTPDSTETSKDKANVRDGHYPIWGPMHLLYKVTSKGEPENAAIRGPLLDLVGYLAGTKALPNGVSLFDVYALNGLVPECAMRVSRSQDGGAITPFHPESPCGCAFEEATGGTACKKCPVQGDCATGETCSQGFCESNP